MLSSGPMFDSMVDVAVSKRSTPMLKVVIQSAAVSNFV
jgi:hypothetical protein